MKKEPPEISWKNHGKKNSGICKRIRGKDSEFPETIMEKKKRFYLNYNIFSPYFKHRDDSLMNFKKIPKF